MEVPVATGLETLIDVVGDMWTQMTTLVGTISGNSLLLIGLGFTFAFGIVKLAKRLMGIRR